MAKPLSPHCPDCNAAIPLVAGQTLYRCEFCGASIDLGGHQAPQPVYVRAPRTTYPSAMVGVYAVLAVVAVLVVGVLLVPASSHKANTHPVASYAPPRIPARPASPPEPLAQWNDRAPFWVADVNGDGVDDVVGEFRAEDKGTQHTYVGAFNGKTLSLLWKSRPLDDAYPALHTAVQGDRVVVTPGKTAVEILNAATGAKTAQATLSDTPTRLCPARGDGRSVWIGVNDGASVSLDVSTGALSPARKPVPGCENPVGAQADVQSCVPYAWRTRASNAHCQVTFNSPRLEGFAGDRTYHYRDLKIVTGKRAPGTAVPMLAVFENAKREPRWMHALADGDAFAGQPSPPDTFDVEGDQVFSVYRLNTGGDHLVSRRLSDGASLWDVVLPPAQPGSRAEMIWVAHGRVYVPHGARLDVFTAKDGKYLGNVGER